MLTYLYRTGRRGERDMRHPRLPAVEKQLCREYGLQAREFYPGRAWPDVEPLVRRMWHHETRALAWSEAKPIIHAAWSDSTPEMPRIATHDAWQQA
jgi:hypothetical protein